MRKRTIKWMSLALLLVLVLTGCSRTARDDAEEADGYSLFYLNTEGNALIEVKYQAQAEKFDGILKEVLRVLQESPDDEKRTPFPEGVQVDGYTKLGENVTIDLNAAFLGVTNVEKVMFEAALIKTVAMLPGVYNVSITVDHQPLTDEYGQIIPGLNEDSFIDSQSGSINSYRNLNMTLFFANEDGTALVPETRLVYFNSNVSTEMAVVEQVLRGPLQPGALSVTSRDVGIRSVRIADETCVIDFEESFNALYDERIEPEVCLYAFVNSICDVCHVSAVQFEIGGEKNVRFRDAISLENPFSRNEALILIPGQVVPEVMTESETEDITETASESESEESREGDGSGDDTRTGAEPSGEEEGD